MSVCNSPSLPLALIAIAAATTPSAAAGQSADPKAPSRALRPFDRSRDLAIPSRLPALRQAEGQRTQPLRKPSPPIRKPTRTRTPPRVTPPTGDVPEASAYADLKTGRSDSCRPPAPNQMVSFDFEGEITDLVETISKITCRNFILTSKVRSQKFKIVSPTPIRARNAWRVFLAALEANDFTVVPSGRYWKIVQANDGTRSTVPFYGEGESLRGRGEVFPTDEQMVTKIYRVEHGGNTNNIVNYLNIFKSNRGQLHPFQGSNLIVMTDFASNLERLERILDELDQPSVLERIHIVPVTYASASEIAEKLTQVFEPQNPAARKGQASRPTPRIARSATKRPQPKAAPKPSQPDDVGGGSVSKILADDRTNKIIVIASDSTYRQIIALMRSLDVPEDAADGQIHVLRLKHADAEELAQTLSSLAQGNQPSRSSTRRTPARGRAATAATPAGATSAALFQGEVQVTADKPTNSLVITASKSDLASIRRVIDQLDVIRFQVFVEAAILEVSTSNDRSLGVGWHGVIPTEVGGEDAPILLSNTPSQDLSSLNATINPLNLTSLLGLATAFRGPAAEGLDFLPSQGGIPSVGVVLQALQSSNDVNVVSTPHLLTVDNEEAEIQVNEKRPFPSGLSFGVGGALGGLAGAAGGDAGAAGALGNLGGLGLGQVSFNREDIGLTLKIKPQINDEDYVRLEIDQELSDVAGIDQVTQQVITSKRSAKTTVVVRSQDSVVIGGLVRDRETRDESKFPVLGDIPVLGWLFKRQAKTVEKVNLVLILTPYIIRGPSDFREIFERKMEERREFVELFYGQTEEYRARIDWSRKLGPIAAYQRGVRREMMKAENDGPGLPGEVIIRPPEQSDDPEQGIPLGPRPDRGDVEDAAPAEAMPPPDEGPADPGTPPVELAPEQDR